MQTEISRVSREEIETQTVILQGKIAKLSIDKPEDLNIAKTLEKECTALEKFIEIKRTEIVKPINDEVAKVNASAKELVAPITKAKEDIRAKQIEFANKLEAERLAKERIILEIIQKINATPDDVDLELLSDGLTNDDPRIGLAIENRRNFFAEQERLRLFQIEQAKEQERLEKVKAEQGIEAARLEKEQAEERLRKLNMENETKRILEDGKKREAEELAEAQRKRDEGALLASKPKGLRKVTKFEIIDANLVPIAYCTPDDVKIRAAVKEGVKDIPGVRIWEEDKIQ